MSTPFPFVEIPKDMESIIGVPDDGTRMYRHEGSQEESGAWFELLTEIVGPTVSAGGVSMICPVSRAAVHKRIKEGRLSIFLFHVTYRKTTLFGENKILRQEPYGYIPVSECRAWREELEAKAVSQGKITPEELEGSKPDWNGEFMNWRNKSERPGLLDYLKSQNMTLADLGKEFVVAVSTSMRGDPTERKSNPKSKK